VKANLLDWLLERIGLVIFVVIFLVQILRGLLQARRAAPPPSTSKPDALEEERRVQDIQAEIRRRIAERRGGSAPAPAPEAPVAREAAPAAPPAPESPSADPFEPMRRMMRDFEEKAREMERKISGEESVPAAPPPPLAPAAASVRSEELERQRVLAEQLAALEAERGAVRRRVEEAAAPAVARGIAARGSGRLATELRDPGALRRAVLLREVLGTPVGLR